MELGVLGAHWDHGRCAIGGVWVVSLVGMRPMKLTGHVIGERWEGTRVITLSGHTLVQSWVGMRSAMLARFQPLLVWSSLRCLISAAHTSKQAAADRGRLKVEWECVPGHTIVENRVRMCPATPVGFWRMPL